MLTDGWADMTTVLQQALLLRPNCVPERKEYIKNDNPVRNNVWFSIIQSSQPKRVKQNTVKPA
jgi:hypothetical protein